MCPAISAYGQPLPHRLHVPRPVASKTSIPSNAYPGTCQNKSAPLRPAPRIRRPRRPNRCAESGSLRPQDPKTMRPRCPIPKPSVGGHRNPRAHPRSRTPACLLHAAALLTRRRNSTAGLESGTVGIRPPSVAYFRPGQPAMAGAGARGRQNQNDRPAGIRRPRPKKPVLICETCTKGREVVPWRRQAYGGVGSAGSVPLRHTDTDD